MKPRQPVVKGVLYSSCTKSQCLEIAQFAPEPLNIYKLIDQCYHYQECKRPTDCLAVYYTPTKVMKRVLFIYDQKRPSAQQRPQRTPPPRKKKYTVTDRRRYPHLDEATHQARCRTRKLSWMSGLVQGWVSSPVYNCTFVNSIYLSIDNGQIPPSGDPGVFC